MLASPKTAVLPTTFLAMKRGLPISAARRMLYMERLIQCDKSFG